MTASATFRAPPPDWGSVQVIADTQAEAERIAFLFQKLAWRYSMTVVQIAEIAADEAVGGPRLEELRRRMEEMRRDNSLLLLDALPDAELLAVIARADENFSWMIANDPNPDRAARAERDQVEWRARMIPLLDRLGQRPVLRRKKLA
jgi:hypothetical protein